MIERERKGRREKKQGVGKGGRKENILINSFHKLHLNSQCLLDTYAACFWLWENFKKYMSFGLMELAFSESRKLANDMCEISEGDSTIRKNNSGLGNSDKGVIFCTKSAGDVFFDNLKISRKQK